MSDDLNQRIEAFFDELNREQAERTPEQKAHSAGYTEGYLAAEAEQRRKDGLLKKYSEDDVLALWQKFKDGESLSAEEAIRVGRQVQLAVEKNVTNGGILLWMYGTLEREYAKGLRCSVCCRYGNKDCETEC